MLPGEARHGPSAKGAAGFVHRDRFGNVSICGFSGSFPLDFVILSLPKKRLALRVEEQEADQRFGAGRQSCLIEDDFALLPRRLDREFIFDANPEPRPSVFPASLKGGCA
jgi:hypothetical protein